MQPKPRYVAKFKTELGARFLLDIRNSYGEGRSVSFRIKRCTDDYYGKADLPVLCDPTAAYEVIQWEYSLQQIADLYREGKVTEEAVTIAMEILL